MKNDRTIWFAFAFAKLITQSFLNNNLGFHRDEFLYMALGRHLDFGYWSNPPLIGLIAWLNASIFGESLVGMRMLSATAMAAIVFLVGWMAKLMGGNRFAQILACLSIFFSLVWMRAGMFLMPVIFDALLWTLCLFFVLRYLVTKDRQQIIWFGLTCGLVMLNKYSLPFLLLPLVVATLFFPQRKIFTYRETYIGLGLGLLVWLPNLIWQVANDFPVFIHIRLLSQSQLVNMTASDFLLDQIMMSFSVTLVWLPGLAFLFLNLSSEKNQKPLPLLGLGYVFMLILFLIFQGKSYYTLGYYPLLYAAGGVFWGKYLKAIWSKILICGIIVISSLIFIPVAAPVLQAATSVKYFAWISKKIPLLKNTLRWEDGNFYPLPQDYSDMLGWEELTDLVGEAFEKIEDKNRAFIYCENYGQAGAVEFFGKKYNLPPVQSFADSYLFWMQDEISESVDHFIYVNDEMGEDVENLFAKIETIGSITHPLARENGTTVFLCSEPRQPFKQLWESRVQEVRAAWQAGELID